MSDQIISEELKNELIPIANDIKNNENVLVSIFNDQFIISGQIYIDWYWNKVDTKNFTIEFSENLSDDIKSKFSWMLETFRQNNIGVLLDTLLKNNKKNYKFFYKLLKKLNKLSKQYNVQLHELCGIIYY